MTWNVTKALDCPCQTQLIQDTANIGSVFGINDPLIGEKFTTIVKELAEKIKSIEILDQENCVIIADSIRLVTLSALGGEKTHLI